MQLVNVLDFLMAYVVPASLILTFAFLIILGGVMIHTELKYKEELRQLREKNEQEQRA
jgi:putative Mn2+ efflux pump MntP